VIDAVVREGRTSEVARSHGLSRSWVHELVARCRAGGYVRSDRAAQSPSEALPASVPLGGRGPGRAGARPTRSGRARRRTRDHRPSPRPAALAGPGGLDHLADPAPTQSHRPRAAQAPRSSFIRFEAALPNELWQTDATHWQLPNGAVVEILNIVDDHSRLLVASVAFATVKAGDVVAVFHDAAAVCGYPETLLSDNAAVFSGASRKGKVLLESELERLGIRAAHATPYHPQTCGKVERLYQSEKRYLGRQVPARSLARLQAQLDTFRAYYNQQRRHRALGGGTPLVAWTARSKARPQGAAGATLHYGGRQDKVGANGTVTLRYESKLRHICVGAIHRHHPVRLLIAGANVRVVREDGLLLRELTIDPRVDYQSLKSSAMS
jgi:transposase InsO family protein